MSSCELQEWPSAHHHLRISAPELPAKQHVYVIQRKKSHVVPLVTGQAQNGSSFPHTQCVWVQPVEGQIHISSGRGPPQTLEQPGLPCSVCTFVPRTLHPSVSLHLGSIFKTSMSLPGGVPGITCRWLRRHPPRGPRRPSCTGSSRPCKQEAAVCHSGAEASVNIG